MSQTIDLPKTFVVCKDFCGLPISHPGREDHAQDCGASEADIARLDTELAILLTKNASAAEAAAGSASTASPNGAPNATVDGQNAHIHHGPDPTKPPAPDKKKNVVHLWKDPTLKVAWVFAMQKQLDEDAVTLGGIAAGKACIGKSTFRDPEDGAMVEVDCPHRPMLRTVRKNECDLKHTHTETLAQACLIHSILGIGSGQPVAGLGPLFGEQGKAGDDHDDEDDEQQEQERAES